MEKENLIYEHKKQCEGDQVRAVIMNRPGYGRPFVRVIHAIKTQGECARVTPRTRLNIAIENTQFIDSPI